MSKQLCGDKPLKTCPLCGSEPRISLDQETKNLNKMSVSIFCTECGCEINPRYFDIERPDDQIVSATAAISDAISCWNNRSYSEIKSDIEKNLMDILNGLCLLSTDYAMEESFYQDMVGYVREISRVVGCDPIFEIPQ